MFERVTTLSYKQLHTKPNISPESFLQANKDSSSTREIALRETNLNSFIRLVAVFITHLTHLLRKTIDVPQAVNAVTDDHMGVVMSLFQRNDNNQKFLVTLNGYSNNPAKEKIASEEDEERLEMEVKGFYWS